MDSAREAVTVIQERRSAVNMIFGGLAFAFAVALVRGHLGAQTSAGRVVGDLLIGALLMGTVAIWINLLRHPAQLEISSNAIKLKHRGGVRHQELPRSGHLYIVRVGIGGRFPLPHLAVVGAEGRFPLITFDQRAVVQACQAHGWIFGDPQRG